MPILYRKEIIEEKFIDINLNYKYYSHADISVLCKYSGFEETFLDSRKSNDPEIIKDMIIYSFLNLILSKRIKIVFCKHKVSYFFNLLKFEERSCFLVPSGQFHRDYKDYFSEKILLSCEKNNQGYNLELRAIITQVLKSLYPNAKFYNGTKTLLINQLKSYSSHSKWIKLKPIKLLGIAFYYDLEILAEKKEEIINGYLELERAKNYLIKSNKYFDEFLADMKSFISLRMDDSE